MNILKNAAEKCRRDMSKYVTRVHSLRRGGASAYLLAGKTLLDVAMYGRWADMNSCRLYVETSLLHLMRGAQDKVNNGDEEPHFILRNSPRPRDHQYKRAVARFVKQKCQLQIRRLKGKGKLS